MTLAFYELRNLQIYLPHCLHPLLFQRHFRLHYRDVLRRLVHRRRGFLNVDLIKKYSKSAYNRREQKNGLCPFLVDHLGSIKIIKDMHISSDSTLSTFAHFCTILHTFPAFNLIFRLGVSSYVWRDEQLHLLKKKISKRYFYFSFVLLLTYSVKLLKMHRRTKRTVLSKLQPFEDL